MSVPVRTIDPSAWVDAAPFAAHLERLCADADLPWPVVATCAGVSLRTAWRLVGPGPRLRRIPRATAQQLWALGPEDLDRLRRTWVWAGPTCTRVAGLVAAGIPVGRVAALLGCTPAATAALLSTTRVNAAARAGLWAQVVQASVPNCAGGALVALGLAGWVDGNGALGSVCLEALEGRPGPVAWVGMLDAINRDAVHPDAWAGIRAGLLADRAAAASGKA